MIRDDLLEEARALTGLKGKREVLELALEELVRSRKTRALLGLLGKVDFDLTQAELERMRADD